MDLVAYVVAMWRRFLADFYLMLQFKGIFALLLFFIRYATGWSKMYFIETTVLKEIIINMKWQLLF